MTVRTEIENTLGRASWGDDENDVDLIAAQFTENAAMAMQIGRDGDTTTTNLTPQSIEDGALRTISRGWYRDELVEQGDAWLIASRHICLDLPC